MNESNQSLPPVLELVDASKWYGDVIGINQINFTLHSGVYGLLGPNGAGKSTLLKLITGQLKPGRGEVKVFNENPWNNPSVYRRIGYSPDSETFYDEMTALRFVTLMGRLSGLSKHEAKVQAAEKLGLVNMTPHIQRKIAGYSKGMKQRTKLAAALVHDPQLIVLDEPLNGLDPSGRIEMIRIFKDLGKQGKTVLVSSHILHEVENLTRSIIVIRHGRMLAQGTIEDIRLLIDNQPLTLKIESPQIRKVAGHLSQLQCVNSIEFPTNSSQGNTAIIRTSQPEPVYASLQTSVINKDFDILELTAMDENLDSVFQYLVNER